MSDTRPTEESDPAGETMDESGVTEQETQEDKPRPGNNPPAVPKPA